MRSDGGPSGERRAATLCALTCATVLAACGPQSKTAVPTPASLEPSSQRAELCSAANVVGVGLQAQYFAEPGWRGEPLLTRTDAAVDFAGSADLPESLRATPPRSIRWSGWIKAPTNGVYRFHVQPAQARVLVSRADVHADAPDAKGLEMVAGRFYPITVEVDGLDAARLPVRLEWTAPHGARYVIPRALLNLPTETVAPPRSG
ncbi:MAG TPA: PA14 domain-containing protein [Methylibium sp.]|uniref:PA14 domain-containing protein n=1 Tax=Methylibium sp. TaxID=2067992 RepID=UPI002DC057DC|nr:PA14 domain-containing protein [Methylibium sp.]HEU4459264.1 PA14 domain-containing protein [Methylibium sp.]